MTSSEPKINIQNMYRDIQPDAGAVARMRARLERERQPDISDMAVLVFKRYVLAAIIILSILTGALYITSSSSLEAVEDELYSWIYGPSEISPDVPEYTLLADFEEIR